MRDKDIGKPRMRAYRYRCRLCGKLHNGAIGNFSFSDGQLILMELEKTNSVYRKGAIIRKRSFHICDDGGFGISDIQGFQNYDD